MAEIRTADPLDVTPTPSLVACVESRFDDMEDPDDYPYPSGRTLSDVLRACRDILLPAFRDSDTQASTCRTWYRRLVLLAATGGFIALMSAIVELSLAPKRVLVIETVETTAAFLTLVTVLLEKAFRLKDKWILARYKAERLRMLKFSFILEQNRSGERVGVGELRDTLANRVQEITESSSSAPEDWVSEGWFPKTHKFAQTELEPEELREFLRYYKRKRINTQLKYLSGAEDRNFVDELLMRLAGSFLFYASIAFVLAHVSVELSDGGEPWNKAFILVAATLPVLGATLRAFRTVYQFSPNASRFKSLHNGISALSERLGKAQDASSIFQDLGFCEQLFEFELREWMRLMLDSEFYG